MSVEGYSLVLAFDTDSPEFVRGVEVGRLHEMARRIPEAFEQLVHAENAEMMLRIGEATGRHVRAVDPEDDPERERDCCSLGEDWLLLRFEPTSTASGSSPLDRDRESTEGTAPPCSTRSVRGESSRSHRCLTGRRSALLTAWTLSSRGLRRAYLRLVERWGFLARRSAA